MSTWKECENDVEERVPGKQGLKLNKIIPDDIGIRGRRASSRKTRIETMYKWDGNCFGGSRRASSRKTRIETHLLNNQLNRNLESKSEFQENKD